MSKFQIPTLLEFLQYFILGLNKTLRQSRPSIKSENPIWSESSATSKTKKVEPKNKNFGFPQKQAAQIFIIFFQDCLTPLSMQALPDSPESLCIAEMGGTEGRDGEPGMPGQLYLNIGNISSTFPSVEQCWLNLSKSHVVYLLIHSFKLRKTIVFTSKCFTTCS